MLLQTLDTVTFGLADACPADQATLQSERVKGARELRQAVPHWSHRGTVVPPAEFCQELRYRLCIPEMQESTWRLLCDDILDSRGHHSRF